MNQEQIQAEIRPWYQEPWPWFLIILLSTVVIAGFITAWLAVTTADELVVSDSEYLQIRADLKVSHAPESSKQSSDEDDED